MLLTVQSCCSQHRSSPFLLIKFKTKNSDVRANYFSDKKLIIVWNSALGGGGGEGRRTEKFSSRLRWKCCDKSDKVMTGREAQLGQNLIFLSCLTPIQSRRVLFSKQSPASPSQSSRSWNCPATWNSIKSKRLKLDTFLESGTVFSTLTLTGD